MIRRDLLKSEIERLAQVLARIMGLKLEGKIEESTALFNQTINDSFSLSPSLIEDTNLMNFKNWLDKTDLPAEKLDSLSEYLYYELGLSKERNFLIAPKLNLVYDVLSSKHKIVHLVNFHRKEIIQQYL